MEIENVKYLLGYTVIFERKLIKIVSINVESMVRFEISYAFEHNVAAGFLYET